MTETCFKEKKKRCLTELCFIIDKYRLAIIEHNSKSWSTFLSNTEFILNTSPCFMLYGKSTILDRHTGDSKSVPSCIPTPDTIQFGVNLNLESKLPCKLVVIVYIYQQHKELIKHTMAVRFEFTQFYSVNTNQNWYK